MKIVQYWCLTARPSAPPWDYNKTHLSSPVPTAASHLSKALKLRSCQTHFDLHDRKWECCTYFSSADTDNDLPAPCVHIPKRDTRLTFIICTDQTRDIIYSIWCQSIVWSKIKYTPDPIVQCTYRPKFKKLFSDLNLPPNQLYTSNLQIESTHRVKKHHIVITRILRCPNFGFTLYRVCISLI